MVQPNAMSGRGFRLRIPAWSLEIVALIIFHAICGTQYQSIIELLETMIRIFDFCGEFLGKTKLWACAARKKKGEQTMVVQEKYYTDMFTFPIRFDDAQEYRKKSKGYLRSNQWDDLLIQVFIRS